MSHNLVSLRRKHAAREGASPAATVSVIDALRAEMNDAHVLSPDDHITVIDPTGLTQIYNPGASIPATLIVDGDGVIQYRYNGTGIDPTEGTADMTDLTACLDKLLSTPRQLCH